MNHTYFLESKIDINSSSFEEKKKIIRDLKEFTQKESTAINQLVTKNPIKEVLSERCKLNDDVICFVANQFFNAHKDKLNIIAVGGYGRSEFYPKSDTDLLILLRKNSKNDLKNDISKFLTFLWDIGIEASHSTRTISECIRESKKISLFALHYLNPELFLDQKNFFWSINKKFF
jgi:[protein-PII] uridylyltransferase